MKIIIEDTDKIKDNGVIAGNNIVIPLKVYDELVKGNQSSNESKNIVLNTLHSFVNNDWIPCPKDDEIHLAERKCARRIELQIKDYIVTELFHRLGFDINQPSLKDFQIVHRCLEGSLWPGFQEIY